jgi:hypothetical protein
MKRLERMDKLEKTRDALASEWTEGHAEVNTDQTNSETKHTKPL